MADLNQVYAALQKADAAGDKAGAKQLADYIRSQSAGQQPAASAPKSAPAAPAAPTLKDNLIQGAKNYGEAVAAPIEAGESLLTSAVATPIAGIAGIAQGAKNLVSGDPTNMSAADRTRQVQEGLTYQPRTQMGQETVAAATAPFQALGQVADKAGAGATDLAAKLGASPELAGAIGAGVNTALQAAPSVLLPELGGKGPLGARIAGRRAVESTPESAAGAAPKPLDTPARMSAEQKAQQYVRDRVGVDWNSLSAGFRDTITKIASDADSLGKLDPTQVARKARLDAAGIKATRGQVERNLSQITKEENLVKSDAGEGIRGIKADQDSRLHALVDEVRTNTGAKAETRGQVGKAVQDDGLRAKIRASKKNYDALYKTARETEPDAQVQASHMHDFLAENPEAQHLGWLKTWLDKAKVGTGEEGAARGVKLKELDDLRKKATGIAKGGGTDAHYAGEVIKAIDASFNEIPAAAKAWKSAREAFKAHKTEFDDTGINKRLGTDKSRIDRRVALEDTTDKIVGSSSEDIARLRKTLGDSSQEWKEVQGGVIQKLKEAATGKREIGNERGTTQFNSSFRDLFNELDKDGKIEALFSPEQARRLRDINQLVEDLRTTPSGRVAGSDTVPRLVSLLDKVGDIPVLGGVPKTIAGGISKLYKAGEQGRQARRAAADPFDDAVKGAKKGVARRRNKAAAAAAAPALTIGEQLQQD